MTADFTTQQNQIGAIFDQQLNSDNQLRAMAYYGQRSIVQYQAIPVIVQLNPLSPGGVVAEDTDYGGLDLRWTHSGQLADRDYEFVLGASGDEQLEHRLGYNNFVVNAVLTLFTAAGVQGRAAEIENGEADVHRQHCVASVPA